MIPAPPIFECVRIGEMRSKNEEPFTIVIGLDHSLIDQLKKHSTDVSDADLQANTSDMQRFGEGSYEEWFAKDRTPYALVSNSGELAALAWFGPKPLGRKSLRYLTEEERAEESSQEKSDWHTIVYRSYSPFRGKGLMREFMTFVISDYKTRHPESKLWAGVSARNAASLALATKFGFVRSDEYSDDSKEWVAMIEQ